MEWTVVTALVVIVGLFFTIGKPIINLNTNITILNEGIKNLSKRQEKHEQDSDKEHEVIWKHEAEQDERLIAHEMRLHDLDGK